MVHQTSTLSMSPRHEQNVFHPNDREVPQILAEYILTALDSPLSASDPTTVLSDILMTARHRLSLLSKEVSLSPGYVVIVVLLQLLANLFSADNMKYPSVASFMEVYPIFEDRSSVEKEKLFHTANWMHILFQITTAKKNKGLVMAIIPKFVEGNGVQYVTGSGQTQPTKDRVTVYETEGNVKPIKRLHRKSKQEILELAKQNGTGGSKSKKSTKKKATYVKRKTFSDGSSSRGRGRGGGAKKTAAVVVARPRSSRLSARASASVRLSHSPTVQFFAEDEGYGDDNEEEEDDDDEDDYNVEQGGGDMAVDDEEEEEECQGREQGEGQQLPDVSDHPSALMGGCESEVDSMSSTISSSNNNNSNIISSNSNNNSTGYQQYLPLPLSFAMAPPIPVRRSQSSFSQAAALIASFSTSAATTAPASYVKSPREFYLDVEANGTMRKTASASWGSLASLASLGSGSCPSSPSGAAAGTGAGDAQSYSHSDSHLVPDFPPSHSQGDQQLQMLREVSEDSDFSQQQQLSGGEGEEGGLSSHLLPPHLLHQQSQSQPLSLSIPGATGATDTADSTSTSVSSSSVVSLGSPNPQPRTLERCPTSSLDEQGEVDFELLEEMSRQVGHSWLGVGVGLSLSRSTSASSLTGGGRDSTLTVTAQ